MCSSDLIQLQHVSFFMAKTHSDIGLIGLAVMGQNLALNIADHGFQISVYNRTTEKTDKFVAENPNTPGGLVGAKTLEEFAASLAKPRKAIILVQAGKATDAVIDGLVSVFEPGDIIIDGGNSMYKDDIRRAAALKEQGLHYLDVGTSGGVWGLERGYCMMIGGRADVVSRLDPIFATLAPGAIRATSLDPHLAFVLSLVDGGTTVDEIVDLAPDHVVEVELAVASGRSTRRLFALAARSA